MGRSIRAEMRQLGIPGRFAVVSLVRVPNGRMAEAVTPSPDDA